MTRRLDRSVRAVPMLTLAAASAFLSGQTIPATLPATSPSTAPATQPAVGNPPALSTQPAPGNSPALSAQRADAPATRPVEVRLPSATQHAGENPASRPAQKITLKFDNAAVNTVPDYLSEAAGFIVVKDGPIEGRISVISREPVTPEEALAIVNAALKTQGFTAIQQGRMLKIVKVADAKKQNIPVHFGSDPEQVAETDELITQVIPVKNVDATKLRQDLQPLVSGDADFTANQGSNSLIMTDHSANIKRITRIVSRLDENEGKSSEVKIYHLKFANATSTAKLVSSIFSSSQSQSGQQGEGGGQGRMFRMMMGGMGGGGSGAAGAGESGKNTGHVTATADDRTNTMVVVAPSETLKLVDKVLAEIDSDPAVTATIKTFQLNFADAASAAKLINSIFQPEPQQNQGGGGFGGPFGFGRRLESVPDTDRSARVSAAAADKSNTLVVTAPPGTMALVSDILKQLDSDPAAMSQVNVFQLKYADASSAAKLINSIFETDSPNQQQQGGAGRRGGGSGGQAAPEISGVSSGATRGRVNAVSDDRTNTVVVTAPSDAMRIVSGILEKLDANPSAESALFIYHLKNGVASDIQQTLSALFSTGASGVAGTGGNRTAGQSLVSSGLGNNSGFGSNNRSGSRGGSGLGGSGAGGGLGGGSSFGQPLTSASNTNRGGGAIGGTSTSGASVRATSELVGQVIVVADNDTNSLLVSTASKYREQVSKIIEELDRPVPQVLIKVLVAEVTHDRTNDFGPDFSVLNTRASGKGISVAQTLGNVAAQSTSGGLVVSLMEDNVNATLHALATEGKLDVLSRPYILASDNQAAAITVGQEVPFITNTQITDTGQQINTIQYQAVGIILNVTPHINPDGAVTLDVSPEISAISATTVPIGNGISAPVIDNRSAQSRVTIRNGNTIVIGGMMQDQKTSTVNKIPLLGDIPFLGAAFSRTQTAVTKTELLIFLTPHVAPQAEALPHMSQEEVKGTILTPSAVAPGAFKEHMDGLNRGATTQQGSMRPTSVDIRPTPSTQPFSGINISGSPATNPADQGK